MTATIPLFSFLRIPVFMQGPAATTQTAGPSPLMSTVRTQTARIESVPFRAATAEEIFRVIAIIACPNTPRVRPPTTQRATNLVEFRLFVVQLVFYIGRALRLLTQLEKREEGREDVKPADKILFLQHPFMIYTAALCSLTLSECISRRTSLSLW